MYNKLYTKVIATAHQINIESVPMIFGFRGISHGKRKGQYIINDNAPDIYNDIIAFAYKDKFISLVGTVDPGKKYTENPLHKSGCFHLSDGVYLFELRKNGNYKFLYQHLGVKGWRDKNGNYIFDEGDIEVSGQFDICIHAGSGFKNIGGWSAGCIGTQASPDSKEYTNFMNEIELALEESKQNTIPFFLGEGSHFIR